MDHQQITLTAGIVAAFVESNKLDSADLPALIQSVHQALSTAGQPEAEPATVAAKLTSAQIRKSITPDALISFIDGKPYRMLARHIRAHGMSVHEYKARFGLPEDYPTTASAYSAKRSALAKAAGLGQRGRGDGGSTSSEQAA